MTRAPVHILKFSPGRKLAHLRAERAAEAAATCDPIILNTGRIERRDGRWYFVETGDTGPARHSLPFAGGH